MNPSTRRSTASGPDRRRRWGRGRSARAGPARRSSITRRPTFGQHGRRSHERVGDHDRVGLDHVDDADGLRGPAGQVGSGRGLVQHRQARAAHPDCLGRRRDLDWRACQHRDRVTVTDAAAANPPAMHLARWCTSDQVCRTGASGSPVTIPFRLHRALLYMVSVNVLTTILLAPGVRRVMVARGTPVGRRCLSR